MRNFTTLVCLMLFFCITSAHAQQLQINNDFVRKNKTNATKVSTGNASREKCGFDFVLRKAEKKGYNTAAFEAELSRIILQKKQEGFNFFTGPVTIPVIFHVIHRNADVLGNTSANLNVSKFQSQLAQINLDYSNLSGSTYGVAADVSIRFCMALVDTAGRLLANPGIDRINGQVKGWTNTNNIDEIADLINYIDGTIKPATSWNPESYLNIWSIAMDNSGLLGYATFPQLSTLPGLGASETNTTAGVVVSWASIGSIADPGAEPDYGLGRTLTHELGHFFGLRHIWGDNNCGEDYCNDTPAQDEETSGCPVVPTANNCLPAANKMFENYMDYTDDACVNTFTANQATRSQTVMDNSPRRLKLITSKACTARPGNAIGFVSTTGINLIETGNPGNCPNTKTYTFNLYVSTQATGAATINFSSTGTATQGKDYIITPASVSYTNNDNAVKTISVTVIDDQAVEGNETIQLSYNIAGAGVVAGPDNQVLVINLLDDDLDNININTNNPVFSLLSQNFDASTNMPAGWNTEVYSDGLSVPNRWVVSANGGAGTINNSAHITNDAILKPNEYNNANLSSAYLFTPLIDATGLKDITVSFKWKCNGETGFDEGYIGFVPEGEAITAANVTLFNIQFEGQTGIQTATLGLPASFNNSRFYFVFNWLNDEAEGLNPPFTIDDVQFGGTGFSIASSTDADTSFTQYSGQSVNFYSTSNVLPNENRVIASVKNVDQDMGCINATIPFAGTGITTLTTNQGSFFRSNKVVQLTPVAANTSAGYQVVLYYSTAELAAWGTDVPNLKILKLKDGVNLGGTITASDGQVYATVIDDQRATKGYASFTATISGGFSRYMLVSPLTVVPVTTLNFNAKAFGKSIALLWQTTNEINNKGFWIERSIDGLNFKSIGWVGGNSSNSPVKNYSFNDFQVQQGQVYYYRLRQVDIDNGENISTIKQASIANSGLYFTVSPNPAKGILRIFISAASQPGKLTLLSAEGRLMKTWTKVTTLNTASSFDISGVAAGVYILQLQTGNETIIKRVVIH